MSPAPAPPSLRRELITGALWMVAARWGARLIGLFSTAVLARLLVPADFGLVAMAWLVMGLLETCSAFGLDYALIRNTASGREHIDSAWTLRLIQSVCVALLALAISPLAARYFNEPRVAPLIMALSASVLLGGLGNIGPVLFRKELAFAREFFFGLVVKLLTTAFTLVLALGLRNYWALVAGTVAGAVCSLVMSYVMHPYRPRWCLKRARELMGFSQWMLVTSLGNFVTERGDQMILGRLTGATQMGYYNVANEVASLPTSEVLYPMSRVLFPGFAKLAGEPERLRAAYFSVVGFLTTLALPAGVGLSMVAEEFTLLLLGAQWLPAVPLLQVLALFGVFRTVCGQAGNVLLVVGRPQLVAAMAWLQAALMLPALWIAGSHYGVSGMVWAKLCFGGVMGVGQVLCLRAVYAVSLRGTLAQIWRPLIAAAGMAAVGWALRVSGVWAGVPLALCLVLQVMIGVTSYGGILALLWWMSGRPHGAEHFVWGLIRARLGACRAMA